MFTVFLGGFSHICFNLHYPLTIKLHNEWQPSIFTALEELGCWAENVDSYSSSKAMDILFINSTDQMSVSAVSPIKTLIGCIQKARHQGYSVFGIFNHSSCVGGAHAKMTYTKYGRSSHCRNGTGGPEENSVYSLEGNW